jgi:dodecin
MRSSHIKRVTGTLVARQVHSRAKWGKMRQERFSATPQTADGIHRRIALQRRLELHGSITQEGDISMSVYKVIEVIGTSPKSWEEAAKIAVELTGEHLRDLRVAKVVEQDLVITDGKVEAYRTKLKVSFKYEGHG